MRSSRKRGKTKGSSAVAGKREGNIEKNEKERKMMIRDENIAIAGWAGK